MLFFKLKYDILKNKDMANRNEIRIMIQFMGFIWGMDKNKVSDN